MRTHNRVRMLRQTYLTSINIMEPIKKRSILKLNPPSPKISTSTSTKSRNKNQNNPKLTNPKSTRTSGSRVFYKTSLTNLSPQPTISPIPTTNNPCTAITSYRHKGSSTLITQPGTFNITATACRRTM